MFGSRDADNFQLRRNSMTLKYLEGNVSFLIIPKKVHSFVGITGQGTDLRIREENFLLFFPLVSRVYSPPVVFSGLQLCAIYDGQQRNSFRKRCSRS